MGNSALFCQLYTGAYASVINTTQLRQIAPTDRIKKTKKILVSHSQHQIKPKGYIISAEGPKPDPEKVKAMKDMPPPETKEDVRRFLGSI